VNSSGSDSGNGGCSGSGNSSSTTTPTTNTRRRSLMKKSVEEKEITNSFSFHLYISIFMKAKADLFLVPYDFYAIRNKLCSLLV
jgi:hypothetical protein